MRYVIIIFSSNRQVARECVKWLDALRELNRHILVRFNWYGTLPLVGRGTDHSSRDVRRSVDT